MLAVFNFDSVSVAVVQAMLEAGRLPVLAALLQRGRRHDLQAPTLYFGDRATAHTGVEVSQHGLYFPLQWWPADQRLRSIYTLPAPEAIWERVSRAGRTALVLDPYEGRRPRWMNGVAISGVQFKHSVVLQRWAFPHGAERAVVDRVGRSREVGDAYGHLDAVRLRSMRAHLLEAPGRAVEATRLLLARRRFDLLWIEFGSSHLAGHHFWESVDDSPAERASKDGGIEEVYAAVDAAIGEVLAALPEDVNVIVYSETGMAANASRTDLLPAMLASILDGPGERTDMPGNLVWRIRNAIPPQLRLGVTQLLPDRVALEVWAALHLRGANWARTRAFALPSDHDGYVRLNVRGREAKGIVLPREVDALVEEIIEGLRSFRDASGRPWVESVRRVEDLYAYGPALERLPDLIVRWTESPTCRCDRASSPLFGEVTRRGSGVGRAGNHSDGAWAVVVGTTAKHRELERPARVVDVTATAAAVLGADPFGLAGEPLLAPT